MNRAPSSPRHRQETALCLLFDESTEPLHGRTYVQKFMFLFQQQAGENWFTFEAWDYGPFSRELYEVLDYCIEYDYVAESSREDEHGRIWYDYDAGSAINEVFGHGGKDDMREFARGVFEDYPTDDLPALLDVVFSEYPEWARNSVY